MNIITRQYGGKKAAIKYFVYRYWHSLGGFQRYKQIDWRHIQRLIFVCRGNICRSPYAEIMARKHGKNTISFGLCAQNGRPAHADAVRNAALRDVDISRHAAKTVNDIKLYETDLLIGMEPWHAKQLYSLGRTTNAQTTLLGLWTKPNCPYIQDPYGRSDQYFQHCFDIIDRSLQGIFSHMNQ